MTDPVNRPAHYTAHPSGVEAIDITERLNFCVGNAAKYLWRAGLKGSALQDVRKAEWYLRREIDRRQNREWGGASWSKSRQAWLLSEPDSNARSAIQILTQAPVIGCNVEGLRNALEYVQLTIEEEADK